MKGDGDQIDYGMRVYDPRAGRFLSVDPYNKRYPFYSSYQYAGNSPIAAIDLDGLEPVGRASNGGGNFTYKLMTDRGRYQTKVNGISVDGTLFRVVDAIDLNFWVLQVTKVDFYNDTYGGLRSAIRKENYYFTKPPSSNQENYKGGEWQSYDTEDRIASRQSAKVADGIAIGVAIAVTAPFVIEGYGAMSTSFVGKGLASSVYDAGSQLVTNGWKPDQLNLTEIGASFFIQKGSWGSLLAKNAIGNFGQYSVSSGYSGIGSNGYDLNTFGADLLKTGIGTVIDKSFDALKNLPVANKAQIGRWKNLSYKPKFSDMLNWNKFKTNANSLFNSGAGQVVGGATSGAATNAVGGDEKPKN